jgi:four helix bundle protein
MYNFGFRMYNFGFSKFEISNPRFEIILYLSIIMTKEELKKRTKLFALMIIRLVDEIPNTRAGNAIANQLIRSGTSIGANYRSACRGRSTADFISKITVVEEECDESVYWLELIEESNLMPMERLKLITREANELTAIFTATGKTARMKKSLKSLN